jgi:O-antigen ligase
MNILIFSFYLKNFRKIIFILLLSAPILGIIFFKINPDAKVRMVEVTKSQIFENNKINIFTKVYQAHYTVAFNMFKDRPLIGHGVKSFREACKETGDEMGSWFRSVRISERQFLSLRKHRSMRLKAN